MAVKATVLLLVMANAPTRTMPGSIEVDEVSRPRPTRVSKVLVGLALVGLSLMAAVEASAHDNSSDAIVLAVGERRIIVTAPVPFAALGYEDTSGDGLIDHDELAAQEGDVATDLVNTVRDNLAITIDGEDPTIIGAGVAVADDEAEASTASEYVPLVVATGPYAEQPTTVSIDWSFQSPSPEVVLTTDDLALVTNLSDDRSATFALSTASSGASFFALGIDHIRFGPDHLLFLLVLTLAVVGTSVDKQATWRAVKLVTAFTVGHAISLALAYFDLVNVPAGIVEPAIALSITAAAIVVIAGSDREARPWIAAAIGLIHGLGFASSLASLGVGTAHRASALVAFNLGIDLAQTAVVLAVIALFWLLSQIMSDHMAWIRIPSAAMAGLIGLVWAISRISPAITQYL